ncbi:hypothetical protein [Streptomyces murinus]|uniref:hypothetical protein n=1 Tax=Streptomyces murinus TaxID=33900 RepID=UPI0038090C60
MDSTIILIVLALFGVLAIFVWSLQSFLQQLRGLFDELPAFFASFHRARRAMRDQSNQASRPSRTAPPASEEAPQLPAQSAHPPAPTPEEDNF